MMTLRPCIHPLRDGNGRVSRLLMLLLSYHAGAGVGRYISLADMERACPGVGRDWIRRILRKMKGEGQLRSFGHGAVARWERI